ncbi:threonine/homoserine efflux transporter RhtA [Mucilaginibacter yixingensis]|uniref:Threonine/homoserine efflux transporter RhtA n=1 Tax=Mucilaginibacter yixingensis TaxID=1295612 RepID=A0A2T5JF12_9SPHI|nr:DMT family transporter [Mucilaginibacter yixingensis]PTR00926.1 threonine/homoserine efflux transporter RhtA [Mucilaginibacter yixingensis]
MNPKLSLAIGIVCIAFSPIFVKLAGTAPLAAAFYRIAFAWVLLAPYCIIKKQTAIARKDLLIALLAGFIFASDIAVWNISILKISATVSTLLANLAPVWVGLMSYIFLRKKSGWLFWVGTLIAIAGMVVLVGFDQLIGLKFNIGIVLAVTASIFYSIYILLTKGVLQRISTLTFMFYNMLGAMLFLLLINWTQGADLLHYPTNVWLNFIGMGLICQLGGWLTINYAIGLLPATKTAIALLSQTVVTAIIAAILLHEQLEMKEIIGSMIVLAGIAITFVKQRSLP